MSEIKPILIDGEWRSADAIRTFEPINPLTKKPIGEVYPVSSESDVEIAIECAAEASDQLLNVDPETIAKFLERYADRIEARRTEIVEIAHAETGYPKATRLNGGELPRTTDQLRQAARSVRTRSWTHPIIDTKTNIRSKFAALEGGVAIFGPNNFPLAFGSVSGGDFASAIAAGNSVIAKANSSHPATTRLFAEEVFSAISEIGMPIGTVQLIYRTDHAVGEKLVSHRKIGATAYTGSRRSGLALKAAADAVGKPIYLELSSVNPVIILEGALIEKSDEIADQFSSSCLLGTGQFCTNPGLVLMIAGDLTDQFIDRLTAKFQNAEIGNLLSGGVEQNLAESISILRRAGAELLVGGEIGDRLGFCHQNTLLRVSGNQFLTDPETLQTEAFGNESLIVVAKDQDQLIAIIRSLEGNLTGCVYSDTNGSDDEIYDRVVPFLRRKVGRLLNDKMPTGVAVSPAMNHGGPFPATGHPGFTAVGIPASITRFAQLQCFDNVREDRLPIELRDENRIDGLWRLIYGEWTQKSI